MAWTEISAQSLSWSRQGASISVTQGLPIGLLLTLTYANTLYVQDSSPFTEVSNASESWTKQTSVSV